MRRWVLRLLWAGAILARMSETVSLPRAMRIVPAQNSDDHIDLEYEARLIRRKRLTSAAGRAFVVDLPQTASLAEGDSFELSDGTRVAVRAAPEALLQITGDLPRLAWHIGNRHTPCQIDDGRLFIRDDPVLAAMLEQLGATVQPVTAPFWPDGGAYGHGRTMGHAHE